jgi:hypothetical protein
MPGKVLPPDGANAAALQCRCDFATVSRIYPGALRLLDIAASGVLGVSATRTRFAAECALLVQAGCRSLETC